jgi:hypothetical protein
MFLSQVEMAVKTVRAVECAMRALGRTRSTLSESPREAVAESLNKIDTVLLIDFGTASLPRNSLNACVRP